MTEPDSCPTPYPESKRSTFRQRLKRVLHIFLVALVVLLGIGWWTILRIDMGNHWPPPADAVTASQAQSATEAFVRRDDPKRNDIAIDYAPSTASDVQLFNGGEEFLPAILDEIKHAESSIHIAMFVFTPGEWGNRFSEALIKRSKAGVEVRLTVDRYGSKVTGISESMFNDMASAGIEVVVNDVFPLQAGGTLPERDVSFSQDEIGQVDHRKVVVIDGHVGWMGGAGFEDHFDNGRYHDVFVRVEGDVVRQLQMVFLTGFRAYGGTLSAESGALGRYFPLPDEPGRIPVTVLQNVPGGFRPATEATWELLEDASSRIEILNPYLTDYGVIERIEDAANRGVDVTVVVPGESNNPPADAAFAYHYSDLIDAGVRLLAYPRIIHAKVLVADDAVIVGSLNYDAWALYRNVEISLLIEDPDVANRVHDRFVEPAISVSMPVEVVDNTGDNIRNWFWDKLTYFL